jgi:hypothetical protein
LLCALTQGKPATGLVTSTDDRRRVESFLEGKERKLLVFSMGVGAMRDILFDRGECCEEPQLRLIEMVTATQIRTRGEQESLLMILITAPMCIWFRE